MKRKYYPTISILTVITIVWSVLFFNYSNAKPDNNEIKQFNKQNDTSFIYKDIQQAHKDLLNELNAELDYKFIEHFSYRAAEKDFKFIKRSLHDYSTEFTPQLLHIPVFSNPQGLRVISNHDSINKYFHAEMALYINYDSTQWVQQYVLVAAYRSVEEKSPVHIIKRVISKIDYRSDKAKNKLIQAVEETYSKLNYSVLTQVIARQNSLYRSKE